MVKGWTLGDLPTMETVGDLPAGTYALLAEQSVAATRDETEYGVDGASDPKAVTEG